MRYKLTFIILFTALSMACAQKNDSNSSRPAKWAQPVNQLNLDNVYKIDEDIYRAEQPDNKDFKELEKFGIKEVLNLRYWHSDNKEAAGTNLILHHVRMNAHDINNKDIIEALRIIKNRKGPIVYHCKHGSDRTGVITAMYRIIFQNWTKEDAINEMKSGGYGFHRIYFNIPSYIQNVDIEALKKEIKK